MLYKAASEQEKTERLHALQRSCFVMEVGLTSLLVGGASLALLTDYVQSGNR